MEWSTAVKMVMIVKGTINKGRRQREIEVYLFERMVKVVVAAWIRLVRMVAALYVNDRVDDVWCEGEGWNSVEECG